MPSCSLASGDHSIQLPAHAVFVTDPYLGSPTPKIDFYMIIWIKWDDAFAVVSSEQDAITLSLKGDHLTYNLSVFIW